MFERVSARLILAGCVMFSAGAASGMLAGAVEMDDVDAWPNVVMAGARDPRVAEFVEAVGASPLERVLFKVH